MLTIPRTTIINDDLGAFGMVPMMLGRGCGLKLNNKFWMKFMNPGQRRGRLDGVLRRDAHHHRGPERQRELPVGGQHRPVERRPEGRDAALRQPGRPGGNPLGIDAEILLFPPDLQTTALELMNSEFIVWPGGASPRRASSRTRTSGRAGSSRSRAAT
jgi:hypothetical protein